MNYNEKEIVELYRSGKTQKEIAELLGTYNTTIRRILIRNNINLRGNSEVQSSIKENPFKNYETDENAAYWLGYLIADGCISDGKGGYRVVINTNKDPEHLQNYADWLSRPLNKYFNKKYNVWEYSVSFCNKQIVEKLIDLGITPKKSLTLGNHPINTHILRGIFDGDGCVTQDGRILITTGSKEEVKLITYFLSANDIPTRVYIDKRGNICYNIYISNGLKFKKLLYNEATIFMHRKKELMGQFYSDVE